MWSWVMGIVMAGCVMLSSAPALAFGLGEALGAAATQGTLAGTASRSGAGAIGSVRGRVGSAVSGHNRALTSAVGASAPVSVSSGATWMTAASGVVNSGGEGWATRTSSLGGASGWLDAAALGGNVENAWPTADDAWAHGGFLPN